MKIEGTPKEIAEFLDIMKQDKIIAGAITADKLKDEAKADTWPKANTPLVHGLTDSKIADSGCDFTKKLNLTYTNESLKSTEAML